jgi:hypothetical protein
MEASKECKQNQQFTSAPVTTSATIYAIHDDIDPGPLATERVGNRIKMDRARMNVMVYKNASALFTKCRFLLVESKLAEPLIATDVLTADSVTATYSLQQISTGDLRIVSDKFFTLDTYHPTHTFTINAKLREYVQWRGSTSTPASNAGGGLYLFLISDALSNQPVFDIQRALCYRD